MGLICASLGILTWQGQGSPRVPCNLHFSVGIPSFVIGSPKSSQNSLRCGRGGGGNKTRSGSLRGQMKRSSLQRARICSSIFLVPKVKGWSSIVHRQYPTSLFLII